MAREIREPHVASMLVQFSRSHCYSVVLGVRVVCGGVGALCSIVQ